MNSKDIHTPQNPLTQYTSKPYPKQKQPYPGIQAEMKPVPDCGEESYVGYGRLKGRKALVTGGDSGIGRAAVIAYAREGADVAINYLPEEQKDAEDVKKLIEEAGQRAILIPGDLKDEAFNREMVDTANKELGGLDILTLVAGRQIARESFMDTTTEEMHEVFSVNVYSMLWTIRAAMAHLKEGATITTTSSIVAFDPSENLVDYSATKAAIKAMSQSIAKQILPKGIRLNIVAPGSYWSALQISGGQLQEDLPDFGKDSPFKRAGQPAEIAPLYVFLASQESSYATGEVFGATGGFNLL